MSSLQRFHQAANDALVTLSDKLWPEAKITLVVYTPGAPEGDIVMKDQGVAADEVVTSLRRHVLGLDGINMYKRDLCDSITGALAFGKQNTNPPPDGHWGQQFWDIGRAEGVEKEELVNALHLITDCLNKTLTGGEVSALSAGTALANAAALIERHRAAAINTDN
jgi:hypothetical protein